MARAAVFRRDTRTPRRRTPWKTVAPVPPANWYVDNAVGSSGNGQSWATAWKLFSDIVWASVQPGDTIYLSGGSTSKTYTGQLIVGKAGTAGSLITITRGIDAGHTGTVIFDGQQSSARGVDNGGSSTARNYIKVSFLDVRNYTTTAIEFKGTTGGLIEDCTVLCGTAADPNSPRGIDIRNNVDVTVRRVTGRTPASTTGQTDTCYVQNNTGTTLIEGCDFQVDNTDSTGHSDALQLEDNGDSVIRNNRLVSSLPDASGDNKVFWCHAIKTGTTIKFYNNLCIARGAQSNVTYWRSGAGVGDGSIKIWNNTIYGGGRSLNFERVANVEARNNILVPNSGAFAYVESLTAIATSAITYNLVQGSGTLASTVAGGGRTYAQWTTTDGYNANGLNANPSFVAAGTDFRLATGSPALDIGTTLADVTTDILGVARPVNAVYDLGAYEGAVTGALADVSADATGWPGSGHLFYAVNSGRWWMLYVRPASPTVLRSAYSSDLVTWTDGATKTLSNSVKGGTATEYGPHLGVAYRNIASTDVVHISTGWQGATLGFDHLRATISGTTITYGTQANVATGGTVPNQLARAIAVTIDSNGRPNVGFPFNGDDDGYRATNTDSGSAWTAGFDALVDWGGTNDQANGQTLIDLGGGVSLGLGDDGQTGIRLSKAVLWTKSSATGVWTAGSGANALAALTTANFDTRDVGAVARTTTDVHLVVRNPDSANAYLHRRFNGTTWSAGSAVPTQASKAGGGVFLATDGVDVWCFIIDSAAGNAVRSCKWSSGAGTWGSWTDFETSSQTRTALSGSRVKGADNNLGIAWTEDSGGGTFRIITKPLTLAAGVAGAASGQQRTTGAATTAKGGLGAASGQQHTASAASGTKTAAGATQSATRVAGVTTGSRGTAGATSGPQHTAGTSTTRKQATAAGVGQQHSSGATSGAKATAGAATGQQHPAGVATGGPGAPTGAARGAQHSTGVSAGTKATAAAASGGQRVTGTTAGSKQTVGASQGPTRTTSQASTAKGAIGQTAGQQHAAGAAAGRKQASGATTGQQHPAGASSAAKATIGGASGQQHTAGLASVLPPIPTGAARGATRTTGLATGAKGAVGAATGGSQRVTGVTTVRKQAVVAPAGQQHSAGTSAATKRGIGAGSGQQRQANISAGRKTTAGATTGGTQRVTGTSTIRKQATGVAVGRQRTTGLSTFTTVPPPRWVEGAGEGSGQVEGAATGTGQVEAALVGVGLVEGTGSV